MSEKEIWPFDQAPNVAALTTKQVLEEGFTIRQVVHYEDDHSWAFLCGTTEAKEDYRVVHMAHILERDDSLRVIADLPHGWSAWREDKHSNWERSKDETP